MNITLTLDVIEDLTGLEKLSQNHIEITSLLLLKLTEVSCKYTKHGSLN